MSKLHEFVNKDGELLGYSFRCPGCNIRHAVYTKNIDLPHPVWGFNCDVEKPTFTPSILVSWDHGEKFEKRVCHSFIRDGVWEFLNDCTHDLAGQKIPMLDIDEDQP